MPDQVVRVVYDIVEHDGGWAYKVGDTFSDTYSSRKAAEIAAEAAALRQQEAGETEAILYEDEDGEWHSEIADGGDRPRTRVEHPAPDLADVPAGPTRLAGSPAEKQEDHEPVFPPRVRLEEPAFRLDDHYAETAEVPSASNTVASLVRRNPLPAVILALAVGFLFGSR